MRHVAFVIWCRSSHAEQLRQARYQQEYKQAQDEARRGRKLGIRCCCCTSVDRQRGQMADGETKLSTALYRG